MLVLGNPSKIIIHFNFIKLNLQGPRIGKNSAEDAKINK